MAALAVVVPMQVLGCSSIPRQRYALDSIEFTGNEAIDDDELTERMASRETPRFLGLFAGVLDDYEVFDRYVLERDLERIQRYYHARGYYQARARVARVFHSGRNVRVEIVIEEGPLVRVGRVDVHGIETLSPELRMRMVALARRRLPLNEPFEEERLHQTEGDAAQLLKNSGYAYAKVVTSADVNLPKGIASVGVWVTPKHRARLGRVRIEGLGSIPEGPVRRALDLEPGEPYALDRIQGARQAVLDLGVFSSVVIEPDLPPGAEPRDVPLKVKVEVSRLHSVRLGGGVELDSLRSDVHLTAGWEDKNFLGGLRGFLVEVVPGVVLHPTRLPTLKPPKRLLPEGRLRSELRQPGLFEARMTGLVRAQASVHPLVLSGGLPDNAAILGYRELRGSVGVERNFGRLVPTLSHTVQQNSIFAYTGTLDPDLVPVIVSYPELVLDLNLTDHRLRPHKGVSVRGAVQAAGVGGDARDLKVVPDARIYVPIGRRLTLATRGSVGLLFPANYGDSVQPNAFTHTPGDLSRRAWVRDTELMFLRGFFAGGPVSNRGYAAREIGPHGIVPFYAPGVTSADLGAACAVTDPAVPSSCDLPLGGFTLWEASVELRYPIVGDFSGALFLDAADVSPYKVSFRFDRPHLSAGIGLRYDTPVGPIRLDAGYRIPGMQAPSSPDEGRPETLFGLPAAVSFGIGEAF